MVTLYELDPVPKTMDLTITRTFCICLPSTVIIVDIRINETLQTGAVRNRTYRGCASVPLFLDFTIITMAISLEPNLYI